MQAISKALLPKLLLAATLSLQACFLFTGSGEPAQIEAFESSFQICLDSDALSLKTCPENQRYRAEETAAKSKIFGFTRASEASSPPEFYFTKIKFCGPVNNPESMLRKLFAGSTELQIKEQNTISMAEQNVLASNITLLLDNTNVYLNSFSLQGKCQHDWVYWSFNPDFFSKSKISELTVITRKLWPLN